MFTTTVGKTFLKEYNKRNNKDYSARDFFDQVLHPIFFDHEKYLLWVQNSPFVQEVSKHFNGILGVRDRIKDKEGNTTYYKDEKLLQKKIDLIVKESSILSYKVKPRKGKPEKSIEILKELSPEIRKSKLEEFHKKIIAGERDGSIALGYPASDSKEFATTSGLVSDIKISISEEDVYFSWIGSLLSLGVGAYSILFSNPEINYAIFEGWAEYRKFLNDKALVKLRGNQIIAWNGQWLTHKYGKRFPKDFDFNFFVRKGAIEVSEEKIEIKSIEWSRLFFSLSNKFPSASIIGHVASIGDTNKTIGFIPFELKNGKLLHEVYAKLWGKEDYEINKTEFESLFGKYIKKACELGSIGLQALEPKNLKKYFADASNLKLVKPKIKKKKNEKDDDFGKRKTELLKKDNQNVITFQTYKTWLVAMISKNKTEISDYTRDIAAALVQYREGARKMDRKNLIEKKLFATKRKNDFLEALIEIVGDSSVELEIVEKMKTLRDRVHFMSKEDFGYFVLLLKFDYAYQERIS